MNIFSNAVTAPENSTGNSNITLLLLMGVYLYPK